MSTHNGSMRQLKGRVWPKAQIEGKIEDPGTLGRYGLMQELYLDTDAPASLSMSPFTPYTTFEFDVLKDLANYRNETKLKNRGFRKVIVYLGHMNEDPPKEKIIKVEDWDYFWKKTNLPWFQIFILVPELEFELLKSKRPNIRLRELHEFLDKVIIPDLLKDDTFNGKDDAQRIFHNPALHYNPADAPLQKYHLKLSVAEWHELINSFVNKTKLTDEELSKHKYIYYSPDTSTKIIKIQGIYGNKGDPVLSEARWRELGNYVLPPIEGTKSKRIENPGGNELYTVTFKYSNADKEPLFYYVEEKRGTLLYPFSETWKARSNTEYPLHDLPLGFLRHYVKADNFDFENVFRKLKLIFLPWNRMVEYKRILRQPPKNPYNVKGVTIDMYFTPDNKVDKQNGERRVAITLNPICDNLQAIITLFHEFGHACLHHVDDKSMEHYRALDHNTREFEADLVSFLILRLIGTKYLEFTEENMIQVNNLFRQRITYYKSDYETNEQQTRLPKIIAVVFKIIKYGLRDKKDWFYNSGESESESEIEELESEDSDDTEDGKSKKERESGEGSESGEEIDSENSDDD